MLQILKDFNVLYVDDDLFACEAMKNTLSYFFKNVYIANNGLQGLEIYAKENIHLLLVDYDMPIMDGASFIQEIRKNNLLVPAIIISSYSDKEKLLSAIKLNLLEYLVKPIDFSELKRVLLEASEWMQKYRLLQTDISQNCSYNFATKMIIKDGAKSDVLTNFEYKIFEFFLRNENRVLTFDQIIDAVNNDTTTKKSLSSIIYKINKKLSISLIKNIKDVGYTFSR